MSAASNDMHPMLGDHLEWWLVFQAGNLAFRYGPFTGPEAGQHVERSLAEGVPGVLVANGGRDIPWAELKEAMVDFEEAAATPNEAGEQD